MVEITGSGHLPCNGFYSRPSSWQRRETQSDDAHPHGGVEDGLSESERLQLMVESLASRKPYPFAVACWQKGDHTLLIEPWHLADSVGAMQTHRLVLFADALGVTGRVPFYFAFARPRDGGRLVWQWEVGPSGEEHTPAAVPFDLDAALHQGGTESTRG